MVIKRTKRLPEKGQQHGPALLKVGKGQLRENTKDAYKQGSHHKKRPGHNGSLPSPVDTLLCNSNLFFCLADIFTKQMFLGYSMIFLYKKTQTNNSKRHLWDNYWR